MVFHEKDRERQNNLASSNSVLHSNQLLKSTRKSGFYEIKTTKKRITIMFEKRYHQRVFCIPIKLNQYDVAWFYEIKRKEANNHHV